MYLEPGIEATACACELLYVYVYVSGTRFAVIGLLHPTRLRYKITFILQA